MKQVSTLWSCRLSAGSGPERAPHACLLMTAPGGAGPQSWGEWVGSAEPISDGLHVIAESRSGSAWKP